MQREENSLYKNYLNFFEMMKWRGYTEVSEEDENRDMGDFFSLSELLEDFRENRSDNIEDIAVKLENLGEGINYIKWMFKNKEKICFVEFLLKRNSTKSKNVITGDFNALNAWVREENKKIKDNLRRHVILVHNGGEIKNPAKYFAAFDQNITNQTFMIQEFLVNPMSFVYNPKPTLILNPEKEGIEDPKKTPLISSDDPIIKYMGIHELIDENEIKVVLIKFEREDFAASMANSSIGYRHYVPHRKVSGVKPSKKGKSKTKEKKTAPDQETTEQETEVDLSKVEEDLSEEEEEESEEEEEEEDPDLETDFGTEFQNMNE